MAVIYPDQFVKVTFKHRVDGTSEIGETHFALVDPDGSSGLIDILTDLDSTAMADVATDYAALLNGLTQLKRADYSTLEEVKVAVIGTDGQYVNPDAVRVFNTTTNIGADAGVPPQMSTAVSLITSSPHRWGKRGRMYLPFAFIAPHSGSPYGSDGDAQAVADAIRSYVIAENTRWGGLYAGAVLGVAHKHVGTNFFPVTSVYVGTVADTQVRRRAQIPETYFHHDL